MEDAQLDRIIDAIYTLIASLNETNKKLSDIEFSIERIK